MTPSRVITSVRRTARAAAGILVDNFCPFWGLGCPKRGLKNGDTIASLDLFSNHLGAEGVNALIEVLKTNTTLTHLFLPFRLIGTKGIESYLVRNQKIAECLKPLGQLQEAPNALDSLIDNNYSQNLENLKKLYPSLNNKTVPTDKNRFLFEASLLLSALAHTTNDDIDSQLIALECLMVAFETKKHQEIAEIIRYRAFHKLYITMMDVNLTLEEKQALLLLIVYGMRNHLNKEDSPIFVADAIMQLQRQNDTVTPKQINEFNQNIALLNYSQVLSMAKQALASCESEEYANSRVLSKLAITKKRG